MLRVLVATLVLLPSTAFAGRFDGFSGGRYLTGGDRLCAPVASERANPTCKKLSADEVSRLGAKKPRPERGGDARFSARASGTAIEVVGADNKVAFRWDAGTPVGRVVAIYVDKNAALAVIEYESRFGGRTVVETVGVKLPGGGSGPASPDKGPDIAKPDPDKKPVGPDLGDKAKKELEKALKGAQRSLARRRWAAAIRDANAALKLWDQSAEAMYVLAAAQLGAKKKSAALDALDKLAVSADPAAPEWRVEARSDKAFAALRADTRFRKAVGITADPNRPASAYERLMGLGGKWEQRLIACEQPEVKLSLRRKLRRFVLQIKGRCGGPAERTFLDGNWSASGTDVLRLKFPNQSVGDELLACRIEVCRDSSGEDCVRCKIEDDEFLLRVVRR